ncbi:MAG: hypothetical protein H6607_12270 [Flavobacteriales bacterium]|nr:hypothetical protein [Flavobacteriales bacterium]
MASYTILIALLVRFFANLYLCQRDANTLIVKDTDGYYTLTIGRLRTFINFLTLTIVISFIFIDTSSPLLKWGFSALFLFAIYFMFLQMKNKRVRFDEKTVQLFSNSNKMVSFSWDEIVDAKFSHFSSDIEIHTAQNKFCVFRYFVGYATFASILEAKLEEKLTTTDK